MARRIKLNGETLKLIGKGAFSRVYSIPSNDKEVFIKTCDPVKECLANGWMPDSDRFPKTRHFTSLEGEEGLIMEKFEKASSLKKALIPSEYEIYSKLLAIFKNLAIDYDYINLVRKGTSHHYLFNAFENSTLDNDTKELILEALDSVANFGQDVCFEISPRNVAVREGKLVLLDVFFIHNTLLKVRANRINVM